MYRHMKNKIQVNFKGYLPVRQPSLSKNMGVGVYIIHPQSLRSVGGADDAVERTEDLQSDKSQHLQNFCFVLNVFHFQTPSQRAL